MVRVLNLGGSGVDTATPIGSMLFIIMATLAQIEDEIKSERVTDSINKRRVAVKDLGGRPRRITGSQIQNAIRLIASGESKAQVARALRLSRATFYRRSQALIPQTRNAHSTKSTPHNAGPLQSASCRTRHRTGMDIT